jgi:hypothetical protein
VDANGAALALTALQVGDSLRVTGTLSASQFSASQVQDLSQSASTVITGTLVATPQSTLPTTLLLQVGAQTLPVGLTTSTQVEDSAGNPLSLTALQDGDSLRVTTTSATSTTASLVQDLSQPASTVWPSQLTVTGTLAAQFSSGLCLQKAAVTTNVATPAIPTASPCPSGELPVYLVSGATIQDAGGAALALTALQVGDSLQVTGTLSASQFSASQVQDLSQLIGNNSSTSPTSATSNQPIFTTLVGTIVSCHFRGRSLYFTMRVQQGSIKGLFTISLQGNTQVLGKRSHRAMTAVLHAGQVVTVKGWYNRHNHRWSRTQQVSIHA